MAQFNFVQDVKISVWERQKFVIEAETEEEAIKKAKEFRDKDVSGYDNFVESETLYDTEERMYPEENMGNATIEIYSENDLVNPITLNI